MADVTIYQGKTVTLIFQAPAALPALPQARLQMRPTVGSKTVLLQATTQDGTGWLTVDTVLNQIILAIPAASLNGGTELLTSGGVLDLEMYDPNDATQVAGFGGATGPLTVDLIPEVTRTLITV